MKTNKLLIIGLLALISVSSMAQVPLVSRYKLSLDTVTNTGVKTLSSPSLGVKGYQDQVSVALTAVKLTGTVAGTASLQGSLDGINYYSISATTFTLTDVATQGFIWTVVGNPVLFYRVSVTGSGTATYTIAAKQLPRSK